jgi:hypothetical protein
MHSQAPSSEEPEAEAIVETNAETEPAEAEA